jgi:hypothetical protein
VVEARGNPCQEPDGFHGEEALAHLGLVVRGGLARQRPLLVQVDVRLIVRRPAFVGLMDVVCVCVSWC